jgi:hypothetical protein
MDEITKAILVAWYNAHEPFNDNSSSAINTHVLFSNLCSARMSVISVTEDMLYGLYIDENYPKELKRHLTANKNKGCSRCMFSSNKEANHPECNEKSNEYFRSKEQLIIYVELLLDK